MTNTDAPLEDIPAYLKWTFFGFMLVVSISMIVAMVLSELRFPIVSIADANQLITGCKVAKVYEIGSPSQRRPDRLRTLLELKDGSTLQTENGIHLNVFEQAIKSIDCPLYTKTCDIGKKCEVQPRENDQKN